MILDEILNILKKKSKRIAYTIGREKYTYADLYKYVSNIYEFLKENNEGKKPVIVFGHKQIYMKAAFLACSFAGMAYVPVDESIPQERVKSIIDQVNPEIIIGEIKNYKSISKKEIYDIMNKENYKEIDNISMKPEDTYYIIFTSGSTGIPKGVEVSYSNLDSCVNWLKEITKVDKEVILNQANFSFDLSVADLYLSLVTESEHFIVDSDDKFNYEKIFRELKNSNANLAIFTPSFADLLLLDKSFNQDLMPKLNRIIFCGEKLQNKTVEKLYSRFENLQIINSYGPTECTFAVTSVEVPRNYKNEIPVGRPKKDVEIYVVDENLNELKENEIGEILITGKSVAKGYIKKVERNPFVLYKEEKAYLTGDLGYLKNGDLYYIQRKDKQIKYKGYRIELSDIENNVQKLKNVEKAVVVAKKDIQGEVKNIIAFVKTSEDIDKILMELKKTLPEYMIPKIKIVNSFPINSNGKCDEKKLLEEL